MWDSCLIQVIAEVVEASIDDYKEGVQGCFEASKIWMKVCLILIYYLSFYDLKLMSFMVNELGDTAMQIAFHF